MPLSNIKCITIVAEFDLLITDVLSVLKCFKELASPCQLSSGGFFKHLFLFFLCSHCSRQMITSLCQTDWSVLAKANLLALGLRIAIHLLRLVGSVERCNTNPDEVLALNVFV